MPTSTFEVGERFRERGVNILRGNTVDRDSRQSITCPPEYLLTAIDNTTATNAMQCSALVLSQAKPPSSCRMTSLRPKKNLSMYVRQTQVRRFRELVEYCIPSHVLTATTTKITILGTLPYDAPFGCKHAVAMCESSKSASPQKKAKYRTFKRLSAGVSKHDDWQCIRMRRNGLHTVVHDLCGR